MFAPRAQEDSVRPRRLSSVVVRPLNFTVRRLMEDSVTIRLAQPRSENDWQDARRLIEQYAASLNLDLSFQNLAHELAHLREEYGPPAGVFLLARDGGSCLGCVGLRHFSDDAGEIKRLYIVPAARGRGAGRLLAEGIVAAGKRLGYARLLLDTLPSMNEAQRLYMSLGFKRIPAYRFNPIQGTTFLELELNA
jgi:putative acetyltransferase